MRQTLSIKLDHSQGVTPRRRRFSGRLRRLCICCRSTNCQGITSWCRRSIWEKSPLGRW